MNDETLIEKLKEHTIGGVYTPAPVSEQPRLRLRKWQFFQLPDSHNHHGDIHIFGQLQDGDGRVSSKVVSIKDKVAITRSGRRYNLIGDEGGSMNGHHVLGYWLRAYSLSWEDIRFIPIDKAREIINSLTQTTKDGYDGSKDRGTHR